MKTAAAILAKQGYAVYSAPSMPSLPGAAIGYPQTAIPPRNNDAPCPPLVEVEKPIVLKDYMFRDDSRRNKLAILLASRGQVFSRAMESILREAWTCDQFYQIALFNTHGVKIPDAQSQLVARALGWQADVTWLVEEDNYMQPGVLAEMLRRMEKSDAPRVVSCRYYGHCGTNWIVPEVHCGMKVHAFGCTLVASSVWEAIGAPYCFSGKHIIADADGQPCEHPTLDYGYGGQDVDFSYRIHKLGIASAHLDGSQWRCGHMHLVKPGDRASNATGASVVAMV